MLEELTDTSVETQRKWLLFLLERVGHNNLSRLIDYYKSIGWISAPVANRLLALASQEKYYSRTSWTLSAEEHRISMFYIEKLKGRQIDDSLLFAPESRKARPDLAKNIQIEPMEKKEMELTIHRREVTINNLEQELEDRDAQICKLKERIQELEVLLDECQEEVKRNRIYRGILDQNIRLRKVEHKRFWKKVT